MRTLKGPFTRLAGLVILACCFQAAAAKEPEVADDFALDVSIQGEIVRIRADMTIPARSREVWDVLTDFEHLSRFISSIKASSVLFRAGNIVRMTQTGRYKFGPFAVEIHSEREQTLTPYVMFESRLISGNMKRFHSSTQLEDLGDRTRIHYRSESVPDTSIPVDLLRPLIETEAREHYLDVRREVLKRKTAADSTSQ